jgi:hypothetical protein
MRRKWQTVFWTILAGTTTTMIYTQCGSYGVPTRDDVYVEVAEDPSIPDMSDIEDLIDESVHDAVDEDVEEEDEDAEGAN